jgi:putative toxin-antitoxin system antitoxin component (TIGR02293 family)
MLERHIGKMKTLERLTIPMVRRGLGIRYFNSVAEKLLMTKHELADALRIPHRTFDRRLKAGAFSPEESDRLARINFIFTRAARVFGDDRLAREWLVTPLSAFDGESPLQHSDTSIGASQVEDVLGRIEYGVYT